MTDAMKPLKECIDAIRHVVAGGDISGWISAGGLDRALSALDEAGWRDIASAPTDGTRFLAVVKDERHVRLVSYGKTSHVPIYGFCLADQGAEDFDICQPTLWHPLPDHPAPPAAISRSTTVS